MDLEQKVFQLHNHFFIHHHSFLCSKILLSLRPTRYYLIMHLNQIQKKTVLAMTTFNEDTNSLESYFSPTITIPFKGTLSLTKTLEFIVRDANKKQFALQDSCQLYLLLTVF